MPTLIDSTTLSIGNGSNLNNNTSADRTSVKVITKNISMAGFAGSNHKTGMYYNCSASGHWVLSRNFNAASSHDYRCSTMLL